MLIRGNNVEFNDDDLKYRYRNIIDKKTLRCGSGDILSVNIKLRSI